MPHAPGCRQPLIQRSTRRVSRHRAAPLPSPASSLIRWALHANDLVRAARRRRLEVGRATVFRPGSLHGLNLVGVSTCPMAAMLCRLRRGHHHHVVCSSAGGRSTRRTRASPRSSRDRERTGFTISSHRLELLGSAGVRRAEPAGPHDHALAGVTPAPAPRRPAPYGRRVSGVTVGYGDRPALEDVSVRSSGLAGRHLRAERRRQVHTLKVIAGVQAMVGLRAGARQRRRLAARQVAYVPQAELVAELPVSVWKSR